MAAESNGPAIHLPSSGDLKDFLDGTDQQDAVDTAALAERETEEPEAEETSEPSYQETFDRKYVEKLRRENASYRERAKKFESVFEGYEEGAVDEWRELITNYRSDPKGVAERMKDLSEAILSQFSPQEQEQIAEAMQDGEDMPLTRSEFNKLMSEREQQWEMDSLVADIESEARELGYNLKSREYKILLMTAKELPSGSIQEAHELLLSERQRYVDEAVAAMEKEAGRRVPSGIVGVPDDAKSIKDFKDAKAALANFLDANLR